MKRHNKVGLISRAVMPLLLLSALTACCLFRPVPHLVVLPESQAIRLDKATQAPWRGWLLSDSALAKLLEMAERVK